MYTPVMTLRAAIRCWNRGDVLGCLAACTEAAPHAGRQAHALAVLHARALARLRRWNDVIEVLDAAFADTIEPRAARVLRAIANARGALHYDAIEALNIELRGAGGRRGIDAEGYLALAIVAFDARDVAGSRAALSHVHVAPGVLRARVLECAGWIEKMEGNAAAARERFQAALAMLDAGRARDYLLEANLLTILGNFAVEALAIDEWFDLEQRRLNLETVSAPPAWSRFWHAMNRSIAAEIEGLGSDALIHAREAMRAAPSAAFALLAQCRRAEVLHAYGEMMGFADIASEIYERLQELETATLRAFEEVNVIAVVAETLAMLGDHVRARATLERLDALDVEQRALLADEPAKRAYLTATRALICDAAGETLRALHAARDAFTTFRDLGSTRRALTLALRIRTLTGDPDVRAYVDRHAALLPAASWLRARAAGVARVHGDAMVARLSRSEREVLAMVLDGRSTEEIALARARTPQTIRNTVSALLKHFAVRSRSELMRECDRRGIRAGDATSPQPAMETSSEQQSADSAPTVRANSARRR
jgi:DNA-binding CsgD family transcriptional regulator